MQLSRREFGALAITAVGAPLMGGRVAAAAPTAADVLDRIRKQIGVELKPDTFDGIKAGDPATAVTGIVTTAFASIAVLRQAVESGANLILSCEPAFFSRSDGRTPPAGRGGRGAPPPDPPPPDPVFTAKNDLVDKHRLVIVRFADAWRQRQPSPFAVGLADALGWQTRQAPDDVVRYAVGGQTLRALATGVKKSLQNRGGIRVIGNPDLRVQTAGLLPGSTPIAAAVDLLPTVDVIVAGEVREWETVEYVRDAAFSTNRKGLVLVGRVVSEEGGMRQAARWLETIVPEVPVRHLPAGDPYWRPA